MFENAKKLSNMAYFCGMRIMLIVLLIIFIGIFLFKRFYHRMPNNFKGWLGRLIGILAILGWIYLLIKIR